MSIKRNEFYKYNYTNGICRVLDEHRRLNGKTQQEAIDEFLYVAAQLSNYGFEFHPNFTRDGRQVDVGVEAIGIMINSSAEGVERLKWTHIAEFRYRENKFNIVTKTHGKTIVLIAETTQKG